MTRISNGQFTRLLPTLVVGAISQGSLSGIKPLFSVTRKSHSRTLPAIFTSMMGQNLLTNTLRHVSLKKISLYTLLFLRFLQEAPFFDNPLFFAFSPFGC